MKLKTFSSLPGLHRISLKTSSIKSSFATGSDKGVSEYNQNSDLSEDPAFKKHTWITYIALLLILFIVTANLTLVPFYYSYNNKVILITGFLSLAAVLFYFASYLVALLTGVYVVKNKITPVYPSGLSTQITEKNNMPHVAVLYTVRNEDLDLILKRLKPTIQALRASNQMSIRYFILSDSFGRFLAEKEAEKCKQYCLTNGFTELLYYRWRKNNIKKKMGNINDFLRRWGSQFKYMIVLDAGSLLTSEAITEMVSKMELHPSVGILQTSPLRLGDRTFFSMMARFENYHIAKISAAGRFWLQRWCGLYSGHNAILRVRPFIDHCILPYLPSKFPFGKCIMSHDYIEAAMMRRAGYAVIVDYEIRGSLEDGRESVFRDLQRQKRWCHGNMQHLRLLFCKGFKFSHRLALAFGVLNYLVSIFGIIIWLLLPSLLDRENLKTALELSTTRSFLFQIFPLYIYFLLVFGPRLILLILSAKRTGVTSPIAFLSSCISVVVLTFYTSLTSPLYMLSYARFVTMSFWSDESTWQGGLETKQKAGLLDQLKFHSPEFMIALSVLVYTRYFGINGLSQLRNFMILVIIGLTLSTISASTIIAKICHKIGLFQVAGNNNEF